MTNAIEQARREMYEALASMKGRIEINYSIKDMQRGADEFEHALEAHLEALRLRNEAQRQIIEDAGGTNELSYRLSAMAEERDTLRNKIQAMEMASQTSAEVIGVLREELRETRKSALGEKWSRMVAEMLYPNKNASSERTDPYKLGFGSVGKCSNPFPTNTIERLHWNDGYRDAMMAQGNRS